MSVSPLTLQEIEQLGPGHDYINLAFHGLKDDDLDALGKAIQGNRSISSIHLTGNDFSVPAMTRFCETALASDNRNLVHFTLNQVSPEIASFVGRNKQHCKHLAERIEDHLGIPLSGTELRDISLHRHGIHHCVSAGGRLLEQYDKLIASLPDMPYPADADSLFKADEQGYAPLDNPRLWMDTQAVKQTLDRLSLTAELLNRNTAQGSTLLEAAAFTCPATVLLPLLQKNGVLPDTQQLLRDGRPSALLNQLEYQPLGLETLFTPRYWVGRASEAESVYKALPEHSRHRIPIQSFRLQTTPANGAARGR